MGPSLSTDGKLEYTSPLVSNAWKSAEGHEEDAYVEEYV